MGTDQTRRKKIEWMCQVLDTAFEQEKKLSKKLLLAMFSVECGSTRKTGQEILRDFEDLGKIFVSDDEIVVTGRGL